MKNNKKLSRGQGMLTTIGVIAISVLITIGAVVLYTQAMKLMSLDRLKEDAAKIAHSLNIKYINKAFDSEKHKLGVFVSIDTLIQEGVILSKGTPVGGLYSLKPVSSGVFELHLSTLDVKSCEAAVFQEYNIDNMIVTCLDATGKFHTSAQY